MDTLVDGELVVDVDPRTKQVRVESSSNSTADFLTEMPRRHCGISSLTVWLQTARTSCPSHSTNDVV
jgi:hypothetical protein